ncbi:prolyl oligopeptidase family serine peptidase [Streptomyces sp. SL13]|uniref:Prolyl oligopeptidase family serine peptidase n=1 Tax=Streptantibioticus silvisoli TaxID=2705255 RepID=A0AA90H2E9_9ACTN|nr:prolyl oligopeptidase family serine peptidase [Streptantibioticus silvisoli]MDI5970806.1 prolyl oligopeptidase family serine peptidase [Streptantibioticus silvisoli]
MATVTEDGGPGAAALEVLLAQPRVRTAHRLGDGLLVEADLRRPGRADPVPYVLGYGPAPATADRPPGDAGRRTAPHGTATVTAPDRAPAQPVLEYAYAGASSVTVTGDGGHLFLSDMRPGTGRPRGHTGRALWRHRPGPRRAPELVLSAPRGLLSYAAASSTAVAAAWLRSGARSLAEDLRAREAAAPDAPTATLVGGDLWPRSMYHEAGETVRLLWSGPPAESEGADGTPLLTPPLDPDMRLTGELALTPDGLRCAAGVVRFLPGGHRRHGQLLFPVRDPADATAVWAPDDDLTEAVAAPDGAWFACTAERIAAPGRGPRQEVVLLAADGSRLERAAPGHRDWLRPRSWAAPDTLLCVGERDGRRRLWRVRPGDGRAEPIEVAGSVLAVTGVPGEAVVVRSGIDLPPEVVSVPLASADRPTGPAGARQLLAPAAAAAPTGRMERLTYRAPDGSVWSSWLCLPRTGADRPLPVLVWCHGGPLSSWSDWSWRWNPWPFVAEGYAVLMPDPPLSVGYGQPAVERGWGHWSSQVAAVAAAQVRSALARPDLDAGRVAAMGGSFGGYLALALGTLLPEVRLIASHAGWADFAAVARVCDLHWHWLREYGPVDTAPGYARESLRLAAIDPGVRVLLSHGCEDTHVPMGESRAIHRSLETRGVDVRLMLLPDERHTIGKPANVTAWYRWVLDACHTVLGPRSTSKEPCTP